MEARRLRRAMVEEEGAGEGWLDGWFDRIVKYTRMGEELVL